MILDKPLFGGREPFCEWSEGGSTRWLGSRQGATSVLCTQGGWKFFEIGGIVYKGR